MDGGRLSPLQGMAIPLASQNLFASVVPLAMVSQFWTYGVAPRYLWLAQLGNTLAHELMHTFDINGWGFDENGEVAGWMTSDTRLRLTARIQCLVNQYAATFSHSVRLFGRSHSVDVSVSCSLEFRNYPPQQFTLSESLYRSLWDMV